MKKSVLILSLIFLILIGSILSYAQNEAKVEVNKSWFSKFIGFLKFLFTRQKVEPAQVNQSNESAMQEVKENISTTTGYSAFIDPKVLEALSNSEWVDVSITIKDVSGILVGDGLPDEMTRDEKLKWIREAEAYDANFSLKIVANLSADEFNLSDSSPRGPDFSGHITKKGVEKLKNNPFVKSIVIPLVGHSASSLPTSYVEPLIYEKFNAGEIWVSVIVRLVDTSNITVNVNPLEPLEERISDSKARKAYFSNISDAIIANISEDYLEAFGNLVNGFGARITREGLLILANDSRIEKIVYSFPVYGSGNQTNYSAYVDPTVISAFNNQTWASVTIWLVDNSNITIAGTKEERHALSIKQSEWFIAATNQVLSEFYENEMWDIRTHIGNGFEARISKEGFEKLANDLRIEKIVYIYAYGGSGN